MSNVAGVVTSADKPRQRLRLGLIGVGGALVGLALLEVQPPSAVLVLAMLATGWVVARKQGDARRTSERGAASLGLLVSILVYGALVVWG